MSIPNAHSLFRESQPGTIVEIWEQSRTRASTGEAGANTQEKTPAENSWGLSIGGAATTE
jgi:hypothetical protein